LKKSRQPVFARTKTKAIRGRGASQACESPSLGIFPSYKAHQSTRIGMKVDYKGSWTVIPGMNVD
jgi:hypothetical protein